MIRFLLKKIFILLFSLFIVASLTFVLMKIIPGDPFTQEKAVPEEILKAMYHHYGLDQPWYVQYFRYLKGLVTWDLGPSFKYQGRTVTEIISEGFPVSLTLGLEALILSIFFGVGLGCIAALKHLKWQDHFSIVLAVLGISVPSFILATFLQYLIAMKLDLLPVARWGSFEHSILPAIALAALPMAFIARLTRSNMVEIMQQDYIQTAKSKGLNSYQIVMRHALRNALLPVVTYLGPLTTAILTGSFAVEKIFGIPGLGQWFVMSITNRDYTVIMGTTVFYSAILMLSVFLVDVLYCFIDPRIQLLERKIRI
ncbi:MAG: Oligopeptide transport system permease protein OppB [Chlamydiae bacterium]|nr:Oligopeptide transport system permease protein OppB [Chlamydiota bacterium]